jgi:RNA 2',3'-cyclic 3'-phosphodiesterase
VPRLFIAIPFPADTAAALAAALPSDLPALRRVAPELLHVTLAFIGSVGEERLSDVTAAADAAARATPPFEIRFARLGRFPERGPVRMVWVGTGEAAPLVERLGGAVRAELAGRRVPFDQKPLRPHVTLARVRDGATSAELAAIASALGAARVRDGIHAPADALHVMESTLTRTGPRYSSRARIPLTGTGGSRE